MGKTFVYNSGSYEEEKLHLEFRFFFNRTINNLT